MITNKDFNYSYWEKKLYFSQFDLIIVGSGIVGLSTALFFRKKNKNAKILILEKGIMPDGASTKNAGFACFGSAGELLMDLNSSSENDVWSTVKMRWQGLSLLRNLIGDQRMNYENFGGFELFKHKNELEKCLDKLTYLNKQFYKLSKLKNCYSNFKASELPFQQIEGCIKNQYEGQIDTAQMMQNLIHLAMSQNIQILNHVTVQSFQENTGFTEIESSAGTFKCTYLIIATNGFAQSIVPEISVSPARAQVLITEPVKHLNFKGSFHMDEGYYYFRNVGDRVLFGGGRNLDLEGETTSIQGLNSKIQQKLNTDLKQIILPNLKFNIDSRWSGIMGIGREKKPIIQKIGKNTLVAVRMGGMGIAIGSLVGKTAAAQIQN